MTDKQIIIYKKECYNEPYCSLNKVLAQLKRKEQECEELKEDLRKSFEEKDTLHLIIDRLLEASGYDTNTASAEDFEDVYEHMRYGQQQLDQLKAENEELKEKLENYCYDCDVAERMAKVTYAATGGRLSYSNYTLEAIEQAYNDQLRIDVEYRTKELEEELEQYKKSKQASYEALQTKCNELELENRELKKCYKNNSALLDFEETNTTKLVNKVMKLEQTLTEIKEIAEYHNANAYCNSKVDIRKILQKCEVLDEEV